MRYAPMLHSRPSFIRIADEPTGLRNTDQHAARFTRGSTRFSAAQPVPLFERQQVTFAREVSARGLLGSVAQRGIQVESELGVAQPVAVLSAYTPEGASRRARLEVPVEDLRSLARALLDLADQHDRRTQGVPRPDTGVMALAEAG